MRKGQHVRPHWRHSRKGKIFHVQGAKRKIWRGRFYNASRQGLVDHGSAHGAWELGVISRREYVRLCHKHKWRVR